MELETKARGTIEIDESSIFTIPEGLFGFEDYTKYALIESEYEPFLWFQSCERADLAFLIVDPFLISSEYEADIDDASLKKIGIEKPEDIIIMTIVTVPGDGKHITANFQGPLVFNKKNKMCLQAILSDNRWSTKVDIFEALQEKGGEQC